MGKRRRFRKDKEGGSEIWEEDECRSRTIKKLNIAEERDFRRGELSGKYTVKMLYS